MVTFDRIKLRTNASYLKEKISGFSKIEKPNGIVRYVYSSKDDVRIPFLIYIEEECDKLTIEFSSKILLGQYPKKICKTTIQDCLRNLTALGVCEVDVESVISESYVSSADITIDIPIQLDDGLIDELDRKIHNFRRYKRRRYSSGIVFSKDVINKATSLTFYDKILELNLERNMRFLNLLSEGDRVKILDYYRGKTRVEAKVKCVKELRKILGVEKTKLMDVLCSNENPILRVFDDIFGSVDEQKEPLKMSLKDYSYRCILEVNNYDLCRIDMIIRSMVQKSRRYEVMETIRAVKEEMPETQPSRLPQLRQLINQCVSTDGRMGNHSLIDD